MHRTNPPPPFSPPHKCGGKGPVLLFGPGAEKTAPKIGGGLCSLCDYRYCLMVSEALAGSSETEMVSFMLLDSQNLAAQAMNSSP